MKIFEDIRGTFRFNYSTQAVRTFTVHDTWAIIVARNSSRSTGKNICQTRSSVFSNDSPGRIDFPSSRSLVSLGILRAFIIPALASNDCRTIHERLSTQCESRVATNTTDHRSEEGTLPVQSFLRGHETNVSQRLKESSGKQTNR